MAMRCSLRIYCFINNKETYKPPLIPRIQDGEYLFFLEAQVSLLDCQEAAYSLGLKQYTNAFFTSAALLFQIVRSCSPDTF